MSFQLSPKTRYRLSRIIPFGIIFLLTGMLFLFTEIVAKRNNHSLQKGEIETTPEVLIFANLAIFLFGLFIGYVEVVWLKNVFKDKSLSRKIIYKLGMYLFFFLAVIVITYPIAASIEAGIALFSDENMERFGQFLFSLTFLNTIFQLSVQLLVCLLYAAISENLGQSVMINLFTGRYHKAREEIRIFMFLDMKSSTSIAEKLGATRYFALLSKYYESFSDAVINNRGEVYQYIGDEIVISWKINEGIQNNHCVKCYFEMKEDLLKQSDSFEKEFGTIPDFKAALHLGKVTTGEIGALRKEIIFTGDVLNTTSRIQSKCGDLGRDLLISEELRNALETSDFDFEDLGVFELKGKENKVKLYSVKN